MNGIMVEDSLEFVMFVVVEDARPLPVVSGAPGNAAEEWHNFPP